MIPCPACGAENPIGTNICVKCGTELPKAANTAAAKPQKKKVEEEVKPEYTMKDVGKDLRDALWLLLLLVLIFIGFLGEITHWTFNFTDKEDALLLDRRPRELPKSAKYISPDELYRLSKIKYDATLYSSSYKLLKKAINIDPSYAKAYFALGYLYAHFDKNDEAVGMYETALRFDPNHVDSMNNLGMMYYRAGNYDEAVSILQKAASLDGQNADVQRNLGTVYYDKNQLSDAAQAFQKASTLDPNDAAIFDDLAICDEKLVKREEAMDAWKKVLELSKNPELTKQAQTHLDFLASKGPAAPSPPNIVVTPTGADSGGITTPAANPPLPPLP